MNALRGRKLPACLHAKRDPTARKPKHAAYPAQMLKLRRTHEFPDIFGIERCTPICGDGREPPQHSRIFLNPDLEAATADQQPALQALPGRNRPTGNRRPIPSRSRRTGAPQAAVPRRALSIGSQRSPTVSNGRCRRPPTWSIGPSTEVGGCFPSSRSWSALGPHGISYRWSCAGTSGHVRRTRIAGHMAFTATTSDAEAAWDRVRIPPPPPSCTVCAGRIGVQLAASMCWMTSRVSSGTSCGGCSWPTPSHLTSVAFGMPLARTSAWS